MAKQQPSQSHSPLDGERNTPPPAPIRLTPLLAVDESTPAELLWHIARTAPELRKWLIANPAADAELLEYVSQAGGPGVKQAFEILFASMDDAVAQRKQQRRHKPHTEDSFRFSF
ncbi:hypothetical protein [Bifidobacterium dolichotidis]|uniref:variant leucine-rich repeat-containing protein n=1 Tax=Bifidobacterium dolichotidis TaxID=2306976 RepID=UPI001F49826D|nr:hypothetical protein [Bifidobacterium dolichotidis]